MIIQDGIVIVAIVLILEIDVEIKFNHLIIMPRNVLRALLDLLGMIYCKDMLIPNHLVIVIGMSGITDGVINTFLVMKKNVILFQIRDFHQKRKGIRYVNGVIHQNSVIHQEDVKLLNHIMMSHFVHNLIHKRSVLKGN